MSLRAAIELFDVVVDLPSDQREAALGEAHPDVVARVRDMLRADAASRRIGTGIGVDILAADVAGDSDAVPDDLPGYTLHRLIGRGGMGRVFEAQQHSPSRRVALKLIHPWLASDQTRAWLRHEAEALGTVLHPGIPQVYALEELDGLLILVMELVQGRPLRRAVAELDRRARIELAIQIGEAVAHAHSRGLLHLDLKPDNVRVTEQGHAKVLDFGLARTLDAAEDGTIGGTPGYMPPEQRAGARLDTRADVYALGRLVHAMLADGSVDEGSATTLDATGREHTVPDLGDRDLDAIIHKATQPDPSMRYPSAEALVADLRRVLDHRAISARRVTPSERLGLAIRRSPLPFAAGASIAIILVVATGVSLERARSAQLARQAAELARAEAVEAREEAEADARRARSTKAFLTEVFLLLDPRQSTGQTSLLDATLEALDRIEDGALHDAPHEEAELRVAIAESLYNLDRADMAAEQFSRTIGLYEEHGLEPDATLADALHGAAIVTRLNRFDAEDRAAEMTRAWELLDRAEAVARQVDHVDIQAEILHSRGVWLHTRGRFAQAEPPFAEAAEKKRARFAEGALSVDELTPTLSQLAYVRMMRGQLDAADALWREALELEKESFDSPHPRIATTLHWLAILTQERGDAEGALRLIDEVSAMRDALRQPGEAVSRSAEAAVRGRALADLGRFDEAEAEILHYVDIEYDGDRTRLPRETAWTLARAHLGRGRIEEAREAVRHSIERDLSAEEGTGAWAWAYTLRGWFRAAVGEPGARQDLQTALTVWEPRFTAEGPRTARVYAALERLPPDQSAVIQSGATP